MGSVAACVSIGDGSRGLMDARKALDVPKDCSYYEHSQTPPNTGDSVAVQQKVFFFFFIEGS
jgi:hypothetical protein